MRNIRSVTGKCCVPEYFESVENLFGIYEVPNDMWSKLIISHLSDRAKTLIVRLSAESLEEYVVQYCACCLPPWLSRRNCHFFSVSWLTCWIVFRRMSNHLCSPVTSTSGWSAVLIHTQSSSMICWPTRPGRPHDQGGILDVVCTDLPSPTVVVRNVGFSDHRLLRWVSPLQRLPRSTQLHIVSYGGPCFWTRS